MFYWQDTVGDVVLAFTDRHGGVSRGSFGSLNLGSHVGDDPLAVTHNRGQVSTHLDVPADRLVLMEQVHGADVAIVDRAPELAPRADALVTTIPGLALAALVADCTPVLLWDRAGTAYGAVHCGRPGLVAGVVAAAVTALGDLGAGDLVAAVGPSVCARCYEVPAAMCDEVADSVPASRAVSWSGTPALDVAAGVVSQLAALDVPLHAWVPGCSREDGRLFSHRRSGATGRFGGIITRRAS
ncbi:MAG: laccase domain-containing protein [Phycicoccus sp.]|nr:laccase domain-containing protein [Phycicoccus sp.]